MKSGSNLPLIFLLIGMGALYLLTAGGHLYSPDEEVMFRVTESLAHGQLSIEPMEQSFGSQTGRNGLQYAQYGLGNSIAALPFYWSGRLCNGLWPGDSLRQILNTSSAVNANRYDYPTRLDYARRWAVSHFNIVITLLQILVIYLFTRDLTRQTSAALMVAATYGLATQAWPHAKTFFSEPLATLGLTTGAYLIWRGMWTGSVKMLWVAGIALGIAVLTRLDSLVAMPGIAVLFYLMLLRKPKSDTDPRPPNAISAHVAAALPGLLVILFILALNFYKFGSATSTGYEDQQEGFNFNASLAESIPGFLWSPGRSVFTYSPPLLLSIVGFFALWKISRSLTLGVLVSFLMTLVVQAKWQNWSGGWDWGPRHIFALIAWGMIPLAALFTEHSPLSRRIVLGLCLLVLIVGIVIQRIAISQNPIEFYDIATRPYVIHGQMQAPMFLAINQEQEGAPPLDGNAMMWNTDYLPWRGYPEMARMGIHDFFWLRWWQWRQAADDR